MTQICHKMRDLDKNEKIIIKELVKNNYSVRCLDNNYRGKEYNINDVINEISVLTTSEKYKFIGQNIKYDFTILKRYGMQLKNIHFDK